MQKWEYIFVIYDCDNTTGKIRYKDPKDDLLKWLDMDELGKEGWELISVDEKTDVAYFKRPIDDEEKEK